MIMSNPAPLPAAGPSAFVSYAREDRPIVLELATTLQQLGITALGDWQIPPTAPYVDTLRAQIRRADIFVAVLSPDAVRSRECLAELDYACRLNKRLAPVVRRTVPDEDVPGALRALQWVFLTDDAQLPEAGLLLKEGIETDLDWTRVHNHLLGLALEWEARKRPSSLTVRGSGLHEAENWLAQAAADPARKPVPTQLQVDYVLASRQAQKRRTRTALGSMGAALMAITSALVVAISQYSLAQDRTREAEQQRSQAEASQRVAVRQRERAETATRQAEASAASARRAEQSAVAALERERVARATAEERRREAVEQRGRALARQLSAHSDLL
jgi:hypothetical protein